jgi:hypothetical protein
VLRDAIHEFFHQRAQAFWQRLRDLFRVGRTSLVIGLIALAAAIALGDFLASLMKGSRFGEMVRESLTIGGWVSMWRPLEIFLYDWWPVRREARLAEKLAVMLYVFRGLDVVGNALDTRPVFGSNCRRDCAASIPASCILRL